MKKSLLIVVFLFIVVGMSPRVLAQIAPEVFNVTDYLNVNPDLMNVYGLDTDNPTGHLAKAVS